MPAEKRRIRVNAANLRNNSLYVTGLKDFFPADSLPISAFSNSVCFEQFNCVIRLGNQ
jgi:hypothetical protein